MVVQILAFPVGIAALGIDRFGVYVTLAAFLAWINMAQLGMAPALTSRIARLDGAEDRDQIAKYFSTSFFVMLCLGLAIPACFAAIAHYVPVGELLGVQYVPYTTEIQTGVLVLAAFLGAQLVLSLIEATRAGYQEIHVNNVCNMFGNCLSGLFILVMAACWPTIPGLILAAYGGLLVGGLVNLLHLLGISRPYLLPDFALCDGTSIKQLMNDGLAFFVANIGVLLNRQFSLLILGRFVGPAGVAQFSIVFQLVIFAFGIVMMAAQPFWPAIAEAASRKDMNWVRRSYSKMLVFSLPYSIVVGLALAFGASLIVKAWIGPNVIPENALQILMGVYFVVLTWEYVHYVVAIGLGLLWPTALALLVEGLLVAGLCSVSSGFLGNASLAVALCVGTLLVTVWFFPLLVRRAIAN
jgi:O-antigen/teichoic acid export membrane protein